MPDLDELPFGAHLKQLREQAGLTQEELAERAGLSRDAISALERGRRQRPYAPTLNALADALSLSDADRLAFRTITRSRREAAPGPSAITLNGSVPEELTRLIGRAHELAELRNLVRMRTARLITIIGPGGVGKTRLALEVVRSLRELLAGRTAFISLGEVRDHELVLPTIADRLGIRNPGGEAIADQIALILNNQPMAIVLDNLEHVANSAIDIAHLVRRCPSLTVLVTSRVPLRLSTEHLFAIDPLPAGGPDSDAVALFVERARQTLPSFSLTERNTAAVLAICRRLDGLPLAIELAAARTKVLPPDMLLKRLDAGIELLSSGPRDHEPRLQSVRSAIAWSYDLLNSQEQRGFRALAVFEGDFTLVAAETVLGPVGFSPVEAIDLLSTLVDSSLLRSSHSAEGESRFAMMFTIHRFGIGELDGSPESQLVHRSHALFALEQAEQAAAAFRNLAGKDQWPFFRLLEQERGNWRAALSWLHEHGETELMLRLTTAIAWFWYVHGPIREGQFWLERAVAMPTAGVPDELRPRALVAKGLLDMNSQRLSAARSSLQESLATVVGPGEPWWIASAELFLGLVEIVDGNYVTAETHLQQSIIVYKSIPHEINASIAESQLIAAALGRGDLDRARALGKTASERQRRLNDTWGLGHSLAYLALIATELGDLDFALLCLRENLEITFENVSVGVRGEAFATAGVQWQAGVWLDVSTSMSIVAVVMRGLGDLPAAAHWFGAAAGIQMLLGGIDEHLPERALFERVRTETRLALGETRYAELIAAGMSEPGSEVVHKAMVAIDDARARRGTVPVS